MMPKLSPVHFLVFLLAMSAAAVGQRQPSTPSLGSGWQIAGTIISAADGLPLSRAVVSLGSTTDLEQVQVVLSDSNGRFVFHEPTPGKYALQATHRGFVGQAYQQHGAFSTAIAVGPGLPVADVLFRLQPEAIISGQVVDEAGDPVREAQVMLVHRSLLNGQWGTSMGNSVQTDDEGRYHFGRLLQGRYFVAVHTQPWYARSPMRWSGTGTVGKLQATSADSALDVAYPTTYYQGVTDFDNATPIDLQPGERATADITLTAVPAQHIRLHLDDTQDSGFNARLSQQVSEGSDVSIGTEFHKVAPGVFESGGVPPGTYQMRLFSPRTPGETGVENETKVDTAKDEAIDLSGSSDSASVSGTVRFVPPAKAPEHLRVMLIRTHSRQVVGAAISPRGEFTVEHPLSPGDYQMVSSSAQGFFIVRVSATGASVAGRTLKITSSDPVVLNLVMSRGVAQVKGTAMRGGNPLSGALVVLVPKDPTNNLPLFRADQSDSDGTFTLPSVVPGKYTVVAIDNGWGLEWQNPAALTPYLPHGQALQIAPQGRYNIKPEVQDF